jgi:FMN-dependent NADH-azoreductase
MAKLLYIESSPRKKRSASIAVSDAFLQEYRSAHPQDEVVVLDLWKRELPSFDGDVIDAQKKAWNNVERCITEFKDADKFVISLPMWNFSIPYKLKHYIDLLVQPGYTFSYSPDSGYKGLVTGKEMLLICARGGAYGAETGAQHLDLQLRYMETILGFIGFQNIQSIVIEPTLAAPEVKDSALQAAKENAKKLAQGY